MFRISLSWIAAGASVVGVFLTVWPSDKPLSATQGAILTTIVFVFLLAAFADFREHLKRRPHRYKEDREINKYMFEWIARGGRVVIFTRDHTWANDQQMRDLLVAKARRSELALCLPVETP